VVDITVIGLGFVGLTTALGFAELGNRVFGYDTSNKKLQELNSQHTKFAEPYFDAKLKQHLNRMLFIGSNIKEMVCNSECIFVCVGSPCLDNGEVDLGQVIDAVRMCTGCILHDNKHRTIAIKSTVPPGTCKDILMPIIQAEGYSDDEISIASNPEFLREGFCWEDFIHPSRIVFGSDNSESLQVLNTIYAPLDAPIHILSLNGSEFSKYLSNVMLVTVISFSNELAYAAKRFGDVDVIKAFDTLHNDSRLKKSGIASYFYPGCGYGGYCLPKDIQAFSAALRTKGYRSDLLESVISVNASVINRLCDEAVTGECHSKSIGVLGLAFKPGTDDVRETASSYIIRELQKRGFDSIVVYDPLAIESFKALYPDLIIEYAYSAKELLKQADIIIIATAWDEFITLNYLGKKVVDGRYMLRENIKNGNKI
jgi:UDPglucose 6-dehydrogenase